MPENLTPELAQKTVAGIALIGRTGATGFALRFSDDEVPVVWMAVATYQLHGRQHHSVAAALGPDEAVLRLLDELLDGGQCHHCGKISGFSASSGDMPGVMSFGEICWTQWDPELGVYRRGCAGDQS